MTLAGTLLLIGSAAISAAGGYQIIRLAPQGVSETAFRNAQGIYGLSMKKDGPGPRPVIRHDPEKGGNANEDHSDGKHP